MLRKISIIRIGQTLGLSLVEIGRAFESFPNNHTPTKKDWERLSTDWRHQLNDRIDRLQKMRDQLSGCIGCGCLSLKKCTLYNPGDCKSEEGSGPRYLPQEPLSNS
ncbi:MAG: redox-sensitive transcriptional activator SoxR [Gammaproteobacteria bacterium]|nr:redox-sensitive transcriptional activator SoxR [Gammaproteobacteria bacterium]